jgi:hypothetical protein
MKLPVSISPCPIVESVTEVRFETTVPEDAVFGLVYQALKADLYFQISRFQSLSTTTQSVRRNSFQNGASSGSVSATAASGQGYDACRTEADRIYT